MMRKIKFRKINTINLKKYKYTNNTQKDVKKSEFDFDFSKKLSDVKSYYEESKETISKTIPKLELNEEIMSNISKEISNLKEVKNPIETNENIQKTISQIDLNKYYEETKDKVSKSIPNIDIIKMNQRIQEITTNDLKKSEINAGYLGNIIRLLPFVSTIENMYKQFVTTILLFSVSLVSTTNNEKLSIEISKIIIENTLSPINLGTDLFKLILKNEKELFQNNPFLKEKFKIVKRYYWIYNFFVYLKKFLKFVFFVSIIFIIFLIYLGARFSVGL
jgi:hypothetical protein